MRVTTGHELLCDYRVPVPGSLCFRLERLPDGRIEYSDYRQSTMEAGDVVPDSTIILRSVPGTADQLELVDTPASKGAFYVVRDTHEEIHKYVNPKVNRRDSHRYAPLFDRSPENPQYLRLSAAGRDCADACFRKMWEVSEAIEKFRTKAGRIDVETSGRLGSLNNFINEINDAIVALRSKRKAQGESVSEGLLAVPDVEGDGAAIVRDSHNLAYWAETAAIARAMTGQEKEPGRVLFELSEALRRIEGRIEDVIAPKTRPEAWGEALQYSAAAGDEAVETDDDDEKSRLGQINDTSALAERTLRETWSTGALAIPSIRATPIEGGTPDRYQRMVTDEHVFMGNLYAMATLRIGGSKGRYAAVAEMEVDELLRFIATTSPIEEEEQAGLRPEKLVLTSGKTVVEHGPDGIYNLTADENAVLRGAIHIGKKSVLLVSEVKTTVSQKAIGSSLNKVGGKQMTEDAERFAEDLKSSGVIGTPRQIATAGYLIWAMKATYALLDKKLKASEAGSKSGTPGAGNQRKIWLKMQRVIQTEMMLLEEIGPADRLAWVDSPDRKVSALLVVRACSLFGDTGGMQPPQHWGNNLPEKALDLFDRTLVIDLFGLPVPNLCLERRPKGGEQIPSMERLVERVLAYNEHRFPFLLGQAVRAGFNWKDDKGEELLMKAIRRKMT